MDLELLKEIKRLAIIAIVSDDELMDKLALKGGNAIDFFYNAESARASMDIDFSMRGDFDKDKLAEVKSKLEKLLMETYDENGFFVFDVEFSRKPGIVSQELRDFWGGYKIEFKVLKKGTYDSSANIDILRKRAIVIDFRQRRKFEIDISKFEYFEDREFELDGFVVHVYTLEMIIFEKIRAICQQMPEYREIINTKSSTPRSRDFFDIYHLMEHSQINLNDPGNKILLKKVFEAKKVPLELLKDIRKHRELHRSDFISLKDTVKAGIELKPYDFYFDYVVDKFEGIEF
ncbi:nucleotidyl transferase AbiEii/AbiGii toxin family protein [Candidatus Poribacteria bacterium]|nr:nucleotidyl transferase AbiEii/AbiGii toxin family protein [Candidatus Poribacteria bacterium]